MLKTDPLIGTVVIHARVGQRRQRCARDPGRADTCFPAFGHSIAIGSAFDAPRTRGRSRRFLAERLETAEPVQRSRLEARLTYLRRRSHVLDAAVMMATLGGIATSFAGLLLFVGTLRDQAGISLFVAFGFALLFTMGALLAFLIEMLLASRGIRDLATSASEEGDAAEPFHDEGDQGAAQLLGRRFGLRPNPRLSSVKYPELPCFVGVYAAQQVFAFARTGGRSA